MEKDSIANRVKKWCKCPYDDDMSVSGWFAFLGMLAVITFLWSRILRAIAINE